MKAEDFFRHYASALLIWQHVEEALFKFMFMFFANEDLKRVGAIYYSQESFSGKLRVVEAVAKVELWDEELVDWKKLVKRMKDASGDRNVLAHFTAVADDIENDDIDLVLAPAAFVPSEIQRVRTRKYDGDGCALLSAEFLQLSSDIKDFELRCRSMRPKS